MAQRLTLKKHERLKSVKAIEHLFDSGSSHFSYPIKAIYAFKPLDKEEWPLKFAVSVPKRKIKKAVHRNHIKRRIREAYRINKLPLQDLVKSHSDQQLCLMLIFIESKIVPYPQIEKAVTSLLDRLIHELKT